MVLPVGMIISLVTSVMNGPINKALDAFVQDQELRRKLQADLEAKLVEHLGKSQELEQAIVLAEVKSEHWLTRSWRPLLMLTLAGFHCVCRLGRSVVGSAERCTCTLQSALAGAAPAVLGFPVRGRWGLYWRADAGKSGSAGFNAEATLTLHPVCGTLYKTTA